MVLNIFNELKKTMDKELKEIRKTMMDENMNKEIEVVKEGTKTWKQARFPSVGTWMNKQQYIQTMEFIQH